MARAKKLKVKSHRGAKKRFRMTASGRLKRTFSNMSHILTKKPRNRKRRLRQLTYVHPADQKNVARLLPYG